MVVVVMVVVLGVICSICSGIKKEESRRFEVRGKVRPNTERCSLCGVCHVSISYLFVDSNA